MQLGKYDVGEWQKTIKVLTNVGLMFLVGVTDDDTCMHVFIWESIHDHH